MSGNATTVVQARDRDGHRKKMTDKEPLVPTLNQPPPAYTSTPSGKKEPIVGDFGV